MPATVKPKSEIRIGFALGSRNGSGSDEYRAALAGAFVDDESSAFTSEEGEKAAGKTAPATAGSAGTAAKRIGAAELVGRLEPRAPIARFAGIGQCEQVSLNQSPGDGIERGF